MTSSVDDGVLTIRRRTYRPGDLVHVLFGGIAALVAVLLGVIATTNSTLTSGLATPAVIAAAAAYAYFALTRVVNRRTVTVRGGRVTAKDGPLPQFVRSVDAPIDEYGKTTVRSVMRFTFPPTHRYRLYSVGGDTAPDLFRRLPTEDEAKYAAARYNAFTSGSGSD